jgi:hypothetical protein
VLNQSFPELAEHPWPLADAFLIGVLHLAGEFINEFIDEVQDSFVIVLEKLYSVHVRLRLKNRNAG